jgi:hypothetical protein
MTVAHQRRDLEWRDTHDPTCVRSAAMTARAALALIAATTVLAGCSGDDEPNDPTISPVAEPTFGTVATTTVAATTTTITITPPASTTTTTTTVAKAVTSTTSTTSTPPSVSPDDITEAEALDRQMAIDVGEDWVTATRLFRRAQTDPGDPSALDRVLAHVAPEWAERTRRLIQQLHDANQRLLPEPLVEPTLAVESGPVAVADTSDEVMIVVCEVDAWVVVESGTGPNGDDTVLNDTVTAVRAEVRLRLIDGPWKIVQVLQLAEWQGATTCA